MSRLHRDAPPLVVAFHALTLERSPVKAAGWREVRCRPRDLVAATEPTLAWIETNVGLDAAKRAVDELPDVPIAAALCTGFAGGLDACVPPGTIVVADPLVDEAGHVHPVPLADSVVDAANDAGLPCLRAGLVTVGVLFETLADKVRLRSTYGAVAVDMESAVLASALAARNIPSATARVVLDAADEPVPATPWSVLRRPSLLLPGIRIGLRLRPCARISARLLEAWLGRRGRQS